MAHIANPHGPLTNGKFLRVAVLMDSRTLTVRARVVFGTSSVTELYSRTIKGQIRQGQRERISVEAPFVSEPFFSKRGRVGSFRPVPIHIISTTGGDAQPGNDMGPNDVGNLLPVFNPGDLANPAEFRFPDTALSVGACPGTGTIVWV